MSTDMQNAEATGLRFSVIVPVYGQWEFVPALIAAIERQTFPAERFQLILVDNGTPGFAPPGRLPANAGIIDCREPGSYAARDDGAHAALGEILVFTDADCRPHPGWLAAFDRAAEEGGQLLGGAVTPVASSRPNAFEIHGLVRGIPQERYVERGYAATANLAVSADLYRKLGGFDRNRYSGGDADLCWRARDIGMAVRLVPGARIDHLARRNWRDVATKARRIAGARLASGSRSARFRGAIATIAPPIIAWSFDLTAPNQPLRRRLIAGGIDTLIWAVQIGEFLRLAFGFPPERR